MSIPGGTFRCAVQGVLAGGEVFSWGWWARMGGDDAATAAVFAGDVLADSDFREFLVRVRGLQSGRTTSVSLAVGRYGSDGRIDDAATVDLGSDHASGSGTSYHPNYVALCVTLRDGSPGARHRNRFYLPATGVTLADDGTLPIALATSIAEDAAAYYVGGTAVVMSQKGSSYHVVTNVTLDTRMDTQRGRNESVIGTRITRP